jgi:hypothetical protein
MPSDQGVGGASGPCSLCVGVMPPGEWCRACGFNQPEPTPDPEPRAPLLEAIRKARGDLTGGEVVQAILATHPPDCACGKHALDAARQPEGKNT